MLPKFAATLLLTAALLCACGATPPEVHGVPDRLVDESRQFQTDAGLFRAPEAADRNPTGTVQATYLFARLLDARLGEIASPATKEALYRAAGSTAAPTWGRLMAAAALRRTGDSRWEEFKGLARNAFDRLPTIVRRNDLGVYVATMEPIIMLVDVSPRATLQVFDARPGNDLDEKDALAALNRSDLFANKDEIDGSFAPIQEKLTSWVQAKEQSVPIPKLIAAAEALYTARLSGADAQVRTLAGNKVEALRGCPRTSLFIPATRDKDAPCSIAFTEAARAIDGSLEMAGR